VANIAQELKGRVLEHVFVLLVEPWIFISKLLFCVRSYGST
jgi:hypothetical protein